MQPSCQTDFPAHVDADAAAVGQCEEGGEEEVGSDGQNAPDGSPAYVRSGMHKDEAALTVEEYKEVIERTGFISCYDLVPPDLLSIIELESKRCSPVVRMVMKVAPDRQGARHLLPRNSCNTISSENSTLRWPYRLKVNGKSCTYWLKLVS